MRNSPIISRTKVLDIEKVMERLFEDKRIKQRICRDFCIEETGDYVELADRLIESLGQEQVHGCPEPDETSNSDVFRAAILSLASNMRNWSRFLERKDEFGQLVCNYDPKKFTQSTISNPTRRIELQKCLGGQTGSADSKAIVKWALLLSDDRIKYYQELMKLRSRIEICILKDGSCISDEEITPMMAAFLGDPKARRQCQWQPPLGMRTWKAPGMRVALASEFLRNLFWQGFKPDRHVERLFDIWFPEVKRYKKERASVLAEEILYCRSKTIVNSITVSLVGAAVTPRGISYTRADNLVWALGSYREKKGKESQEEYWKSA